MKLVKITLALTAAALALPVQAADEIIQAPRVSDGGGVDDSEDDPPTWWRLSIVSRVDRQEVGSHDAPLRPATLRIAPQNWFTAESALIKAYLAAPEKPLRAAIDVTIGADGRITRCEYGESSPGNVMPLDLAAMCNDLREKALYLPALNQEGERTEGTATISLRSSRAPANPKAGVVPLIPSASLAEPPRPPRMIVASGNLTEFPPSFGWIRSKLPPTSYQQPVTWPAHEANWDGAGRVVGVLYSGEDIAEGNHAAFPRCSIIMSSHNAAADLEACRFVSEDVRPEWDDLAPTKPRMVAFLVNVTIDKTRAVAASYQARQSADLIYEKSEEFQQAIITATGVAPTGPTRHFTMKLRLDQTGQATHCQITTSSGSDAGDIAACKIAREGIWYTPDHDVFGRPVAGAIVTWYPY